MKYLKKFNEQEESIEYWCRYLDIINYEIIKDVVNVKNDVIIFGLKLEKIPIQFGVVVGSFDVKSNNLVSLEGSPFKVGGSFHCSNNKITTLKGGPKEVERQFNCSINHLVTLEGLPEEVGTDFYCDSNELKTLEGTPRVIKGHFDCSNNNLTTLEGGPEKVYDSFLCYSNELSTLEGGPIKVEYDYFCNNNRLISLEGVPDKLRFLNCDKNPIHVVYELFETLERYLTSLDNKYLRGTNIIKGRFERACTEAGIDTPEYVKGYKYI
jgi:hypothetical protein